MMNFYFVPRVTSSVITSLLAFSFGIGIVKPVDAQDISKNKGTDCSIPSKSATGKLRITVDDVTLSVASLNGKSIYGNTQEVKRIADIIASKLANNPNFIVIDRMQKGNSTLCAEAIIIVSITRFDIDTRTSGRSFLGFGKTKNNKSAYVELSLRIINAATNEIIDSFTETGNTTTLVKSEVSIPKITLNASNYNDYTNTVNTLKSDSSGINDVNNTKFTLILDTSKTEKISTFSIENEGSLMTLAAKEAINKIVAKVNDNSGKIISTLRPFDTLNSLVVGISGNYFVLNHGKLHGYQRGMKLKIKEITSTFVDPQTKEVIRILTSHITDVKVTDVNNKSSLAKIIDSDKNVILFGKNLRTQIEQGNIIAIPIK